MTRRILLLASLVATLAIAGCGGKPPPPRPRGSTPVTLHIPTSRETQACFTDLSREDVRFSPLPDRDYGGGCRIIGAVQLIDIGLPVTNLKAMRCGLARSFTAWARHAAVPAAHQMLGSDLVRIESYGTYACRNTIGTAHVALSGHATANAVDVAAFVLQDGRRISVLDGWNGPDLQVRAFLRTVHTSACKRFGTVLSPDYNTAHRNHFHLEDDHKGFCR